MRSPKREKKEEPGRESIVGPQNRRRHLRRPYLTPNPNAIVQPTRLGRAAKSSDEGLTRARAFEGLAAKVIGWLGLSAIIACGGAASSDPMPGFVMTPPPPVVGEDASVGASAGAVDGGIADVELDSFDAKACYHDCMWTCAPCPRNVQLNGDEIDAICQKYCGLSD